MSNNTCTASSCENLESAKGLCKKHYMAAYHQEHVREHNKKSAEWCAANRPRKKEAQKSWHILYPEYWTVKSHWWMIFSSKRHPTYAGMPFFDLWNPRKGGAFKTAASWIVDNLGHRPGKGYQLHIIQKSVGFVPGNLMWLPVSQHKRNELINLVLEENRQLRQENQVLLLKLSEKTNV